VEYQRQDTLLTFEQGLAEYYASRGGLVQGRGISPAAREFFRCHDAAHVVFGCDTTLVEEAMVKMWSFFGTTAGLALVRGYRLAESQEIYERIGWRETIATALRSAGVLPRVIWRAARMRKRWPWSEFAPYRPAPLAEIRREFGIVIVRP
jgi:hypothetical protein